MTDDRKKFTLIVLRNWEYEERALLVALANTMGTPGAGPDDWACGS